MKNAKKVKAADLHQYLNESRGLERDYLGEVLKSRQTAWYVVLVFGIITVVALGAAMLGLRQTAPPPMILRVDNATGAVDLLTAIKETEATYGEVVDIYWLNKYVLNRESYDYYHIQMLYETTALLSTPAVQREYYSLFEGAAARDKVLGQDRILVTIKSITPHQQGGSAVVRFTTQEVSSQGYYKGAIRNLIATIGYTYVDTLISAQDRRINPLGFQVTSYRVDAESIN